MAGACSCTALPGDRVYALNARTGRIAASFQAGDYPHELELSPNGRLLYNGSLGDQLAPFGQDRGLRQLTVVDARTLAVVRTLPSSTPACARSRSRRRPDRLVLQLSYLNGFVMLDLRTGRRRTVELPLSSAAARLLAGRLPEQGGPSRDRALGRRPLRVRPGHDLRLRRARPPARPRAVQIVPVGMAPGEAITSRDGPLLHRGLARADGAQPPARARRRQRLGHLLRAAPGGQAAAHGKAPAGPRRGVGTGGRAAGAQIAGRQALGGARPAAAANRALRERGAKVWSTFRGAETAMSYLRTVTTRRLLVLCAAVMLAAGAVTAIALAATGWRHQAAAQAARPGGPDALSAPQIKGVTARISFTNRLVDSGTLRGSDPILTGASGRLWASGDRLRLELQAAPDTGGGDVQVAVDGANLTVYEAARGPSTGRCSPSDRGRGRRRRRRSRASSRRSTRLASASTLSGASPSNVAGPARLHRRASRRARRRAARRRRARLGRRQRRAAARRRLRGRQQLAGARAEGDRRLLRLGRRARSSTSTPPATPRSVDLDARAPAGGAGRAEPSRSRAWPRSPQASPFALAAPDTLAGLPRTRCASIELDGRRRRALVTYGARPRRDRRARRQPARAAATGARAGGEGEADRLPTVSINGATGQELDTALGHDGPLHARRRALHGVGSVPPAAAEAAARGL